MGEMLSYLLPSAKFNVAKSVNNHNNYTIYCQLLASLTADEFKFFIPPQRILHSMCHFNTSSKTSQTARTDSTLKLQTE